jgi:hypothetical protein
MARWVAALCVVGIAAACEPLRTGAELLEALDGPPRHCLPVGGPRVLPEAYPSPDLAGVAECVGNVKVPGEDGLVREYHSRNASLDAPGVLLGDFWRTRSGGYWTGCTRDRGNRGPLRRAFGGASSVETDVLALRVTTAHRVRLVLHADSMDGLLFGINGTRRLGLVPPEATRRLLDRTVSSGTRSASVCSADPRADPRVWDGAPWYYAVLAPREVLHIPAGWGHYVEIDPWSVGLSVQWS